MGWNNKILVVLDIIPKDYFAIPQDKISYFRILITG